MRVTRWLLAALALLLATGLAVAWLLPQRLDGERFRDPLQSLASRTLGAPVRIDGPIRLRLLPQPVLVAGRLDISGAGGTLSARGLRLQLALAPLLAGRIEARALVLRHPDLRLPAPFDPRALLARRPSWLGGAAIRVQDGRIAVGGVVLDGVDASLDADPLTGDLAAAGDATAAGNAWAFSVRLMRPGGDGAAGVDVSLAGRGPLGGTALTLSGQLAADGGLQGHGAARGPDLSLLLPAPALPFSAEGRVSLGGGLAEADDLTVEFGAVPARGAVALRFAPAVRLDLALAASRLDLDPWLALLRSGEGGPSAWNGIPVGVDLSAEAAVLQGGTLRGLRAAFDIAGGKVVVRELRAMLPGDAALHVTGTMLAAPAMRFEGDAALDAPAWQATAAWLAPLLPSAASLSLAAEGALDVSAHVAADRDGIALSRIAGTRDGGTVAGSLGWRRDAHNAAGLVTARLSLQRLALDPFLAAGGARPDLDLEIDAALAVARGITMAPLRLAPLRLAPLRLALTRRGGTVDVRGARAGVGGVRFEGAGQWSAAGRLDGGRLSLDAPRLALLQSLPGGGWLTLPPESPLLGQKLHVALDASGTWRAMSARLRVQLGDDAAGADPTIDLGARGWSGPVTLRGPSARNLLEATRGLALLGLPGDAGWLGEGSLALSADCAGGPGTLSADDIDLAAGSLRAGGTLRLDWSGTQPRLSGRIEAASLPLPPFDSRFADAWLLGGPPRWSASLQMRAQRVLSGGAALFAPFAASVTLGDGVLRLDGVQAGLAGGALAGGALQGGARLDLAADPPRLQAQESVRGASIGGGLTGLPVDIAAGRLDLDATLMASGHSEAAMRAALHGQARARVAAGMLQGVSLGALPPDFPPDAVQAALAGGSTAFGQADLAATLQGGVATLTEGRIALPAGVVAVSGSYDLSQSAADLTLAFQPSTAPSGSVSPPMIGLRLVGGGGSAGVQRIAQLAPLARWRASRPQP